MAASNTPQLPLMQKARLIFILAFVIPPVSVWNITRAAVRAWVQRLPVRAMMWNGFVRALMRHIPPRLMQTLMPPTEATYKAWISSTSQRFGLVHDTEILSDGSTKLHWLGRRDCKKVILFFHGGFTSCQKRERRPKIRSELLRNCYDRGWVRDAYY